MSRVKHQEQDNYFYTWMIVGPAKPNLFRLWFSMYVLVYFEALCMKFRALYRLHRCSTEIFV